MARPVAGTSLRERNSHSLTLCQAPLAAVGLLRSAPAILVGAEPRRTTSGGAAQKGHRIWQQSLPPSPPSFLGLILPLAHPPSAKSAPPTFPAPISLPIPQWGNSPPSSCPRHLPSAEAQHQQVLHSHRCWESTFWHLCKTQPHWCEHTTDIGHQRLEL